MYEYDGDECACSEDHCDYDLGDDDDKNFNDELEQIYNRLKKLNDESNFFKVLSTEEIVNLMQDHIRLVTIQFKHIPVPTIRALLNYLKGIPEQVTDRLYEDPEQIFKEVRLANPYNMQKVKPKCKRLSRNGFKDCEICCTKNPLSDMTELQCEHQFCNSCWREYLQNKIMNDGCGQGLTCAGHECDVLVDDKLVARLVDANVQVRYQNLIINSYVESSKNLTWCPAPGCTYAIQVQRSKSLEVTCKCGHVFCFACSEIWHDPVECSLFKKWLKKCSADSETANGIQADIKECPKCHLNIEKNGGCNRMKCTVKSCRYQFCWGCLGDWSTHRFSRSCDKYSATKNNSKTSSRKALEHYLHYYKQYMNNQKSMYIEQATLPDIIEKKRLILFEKQIVSKEHSKYLEDAVETLRQCRETLIATYVFVYYLEKSDNNSLILEDNQSFLQNATEGLSESLERDISLENLADLKRATVDISNYCATRRKILLEYVHDGYNERWWKFIK